MPKPRRRPVFFEACSLRDGTVLSSLPTRKPAARIMKRKGLRVDADGVVSEWVNTTRQLVASNDAHRIRMCDVIAGALNTRRSIRAMVLPPIAELQAEVVALRREVARLARCLEQRGKVDPSPKQGDGGAVR